MIILNSEFQKDTVRGRNPFYTGTLRVKNLSDSSLSAHARDTAARKSTQSNNQVIANHVAIKDEVIAINDSTSLCERNSIADISFYFPGNNLILNGTLDPLNRFPFIFTHKNEVIETGRKEILIKHLKPGTEIPEKNMQGDWIIMIIILGLILFSVVRATSKSILPELGRFFIFRGMNDPAKRKTAVLLKWQSILLNLISFIFISLFTFYSASYYQMLPTGINSLLIWLILFFILLVVAFIRYILCKATGRISGEKRVFGDYIFGINQSYRFSGIFLLILLLLMRYTIFFPIGGGIIAGGIIFSLLYLVRITRLLVIFLNSSISIFYFILYLCALEILPVLILAKYITGIA